MKKFNKIILFTTLIILLFLSACGVKSVEVNTIFTSDEIINKKLSDYNISKEEYGLFVKKINSFSAKASAKILNEDVDIISPLSLYMNLAMTSTITDGNTQKEILDFLNIDYNGILNYTNALYGLSMKEKLYNNEICYKETLVNSIWISNSINYNKDSLHDLYNYFNASSFVVDYSNKNTSNHICNYISDNTNGLIKPDLQIPEETIFMLINSLYVSDLWNETGLEYTKNDYEFKNYNNTKTSKKFLVGKPYLGTPYIGEDYSCFYQKTSNNLKLTFILPNDNKNIYTIMNEDNLNTILGLDSMDYYKDDETYSYPVFPEFESSYSDDLKDELLQLGIKSLFQLTNDYKLFEEKAYVSNLIQMSKLKVNNKGIEGAAVTMSVVEGANSIEKIIEFVIDRSFGYILSDFYGVPLFIGIVDNI